MNATRVAIYVRVSTNDQSTEMQRIDLEAFAKARGWSVVRVFADTATGTNGNRPQLSAMMGAARAREFDVLLIWKLDRLFRSIKGLVTSLQEFHDLGIQFVSLKDQIDMSTASGRLMTHIIGAFAEFEAALIRERVRTGLAVAKAKGVRLGRPTTIDRDAVAQMRREGLSMGSIAAKLKRSKSSIHKILMSQSRVQ